MPHMQGEVTQAAPRRIRVLIVDDSATMRRLIRHGLSRDHELEIVGEASTARQARDLVNSLAPDVLTLDVEMPGMDGLEFLERLMKARPMPVIMISSITAQGSEAALKALSLGAVDCIEKPRFGEATSTFGKLAETLKVAATARVRYRRKPTPAARLSGRFAWNGKWFLIGSSTGGVEAIETLLAGFPEDCPPTMITQHMPEQFLRSFAARLDAAVGPHVSLAQDGQSLGQGEIVLAPGGRTHLQLDPATRRLILREGARRSGHRPSVDVMFASARNIAPEIVALILTGMGRDGAEGMKQLHDGGAHCIGQSEDSCVVYGMPRKAFEIGALDVQLPLREMATHALRAASKQHAGEG